MLAELSFSCVRGGADVSLAGEFLARWTFWAGTWNNLCQSLNRDRMAGIAMKLKTILGISLGAWFLLLLLGEAKRPLRLKTEPKTPRLARNAVIAGLSGVLLQLTEVPLTGWLSRRVENRRLGLLNQIPMPSVLRAVASIALLDYTLYLWHVISHKIPLLWRFHVVHHIDLDLDASTALRFHFGEMAISVFWRLMQIRLLGINPPHLLAWQNFLMFCILFHHSNVRLPLAAETRLNRFLVTPRMHGIHHSVKEEETNSNWSSGLTIWDKLHGTFRPFGGESSVVIGVPAYRQEDETNLESMIKLPFEEQKPTWQYDGRAQLTQHEA